MAAVQSRARELFRRDDLLLSIGGLLFATGALVLRIRKGRTGWGDFALLLTLFIPAVLLYLLGTGRIGRGARDQERATPWQSVLVVYAIFLTPLTLFQFVQWIGGTPGDSLNQAWIFGLTAVFAGLAALRPGVYFAALLATLSLLIAWLSLWDKIASPSGNGNRWLLVVFALLALAVAVYVGQFDVRRGVEIVTGAGLSAVLAGILGLTGALAAVAAQRISSFGTAPQFQISVQQHNEWDIYLLIVSALLIWYGARRGVRGPCWVGGLGLLIFIGSTGAQVVRLLEGKPTGEAWAWPVILVVLGLAALAAGFFGPKGSDTAPEPPSAPAPPDAAAAPPPTAPPAGQ